jgi:uncharacterized small protein (DUF1192 family)
MNPDELEPKPQAPKPKDLEPLSIAALGDYIAELQAEIDRARQVIERKKLARSAADGAFRR